MQYLAERSRGPIPRQSLQAKSYQHCTVVPRLQLPSGSCNADDSAAAERQASIAVSYGAVQSAEHWTPIVLCDRLQMQSLHTGNIIIPLVMRESPSAHSSLRPTYFPPGFALGNIYRLY